MNFKRGLVLVTVILSCALAFAGDGNGQGQGNVPVAQCKKKPTPPPKPCPPKNPSITINNGSSSTSGATSTSTSGATATGGNATGGNATSSSGVSNSGNSSNTNTANGGQGGQGGQGGSASLSNSGNSSSTSSASNNGNGNGNGNGSNNTTKQGQTQSSSSNNTGGNSSNSYQSTTNVAAPKIPVATAYAPNAYPTVPCFKGMSGGVQTGMIGISGGGGKIDSGCDTREEARVYALMGSRIAACKVMVFGKKNQKIAEKHPEQAVTMDDCMYEPPTPLVVEAPAPVAPPVQVMIVPVPQPVAPVPQVVALPPTPVVIPQSQLIGICTFLSKTQCTAAGSDAYIVDPARPTSVCKEMIAAAQAELKLHPGYVIVLRGNKNPSEDALLSLTRANRVKQQFVAGGVPSSRLKTEVGTGDTRTVEITLVPAN